MAANPAPIPAQTHMELTKSEIAIADRCLSKRERQLAQWPQRRWLILTVFSAMILFGHLAVSDGMRSIEDDRATDWQVDHAVRDEPPPGLERRWVVGSMLKISKILETRYQVVTYAMMEVAIGYLQVLAGAIMVSVTIVRWKTDEKDVLICKLLRRQLQEFEPAAARNDGPPIDRTASPEGPHASRTS